MKKLVAAVVLVGALSMANGAMAYGDGHNQHRDERKHVEHRGKDFDFGARIPPQAKSQSRPRNHRERERSEWEGHRH